MTSVEEVAWSAGQAAEALAALARAGRLPMVQASAAIAPLDVGAAPERFGHWLELAAGWIGLELEPVATQYGDVDLFLRASGPSLLRLPDAPPERCLVALLGRRGRCLRVIGPDASVQRVAAELLRGALLAPLERQFAPDVAALMAAAGIPDARRPRVRRALLRSRLAGHSIAGAWLLRAPPSAPFSAQLRQIRALRRGLVLGLGLAATYALSIAGWWLIGAAALEGRPDRGGLLAWALLLLTQVPLGLLASASQARLAIDIGVLLKRRLLAGALRLSTDSVRTLGSGQLFGRVLEAEAFEALAQGPGYVCLLAAIELVAAFVVLGLGAAAALEIGLLLAWLAASALLGIRYYHGRRSWTDARIRLTHDLLERMLGHRTRLAQRSREHWHEGEDEASADYLAHSSVLDARWSALCGFVPRAWLVIGSCGFAAAFLAGTATKGALGATLGGVLLAFRALHRLALGAPSLAGAAIAWRQIAPLFHAASASDPPVAPELVLHAGTRPVDGGDAESLLEARELVFRYREGGAPVLRGCSLDIRRGDRIVLEGPSGGGKSTLASLLSGLRSPEAGLLLARGLDRQSLGSREWRRRIVAAPQFHENHVLSATFAFNLLLGRQWPPSAADYRAAEEICGELALDSLIARMPSGLQQMVGETGWQLSHGEKSRLYVARALLQDADVLLLDENFASLDPDTLERALSCVLRRARSLVVIAHP